MKITIAFDRHEIDLLVKSLEDRKKKIRKKYSKTIKEDWYDLNEMQIENKLCEDKDYGEAAEMIFKLRLA